MLSRKYFFFLTGIAICIAAISLSSKKKTLDRSSTAMIIAKMYSEDMNRLDSSLKEYPKYFYDSNFTTRIFKYGELLGQFKKVECLFTYFHEKLSYETFFLTARFEKRDFGPPFPDNWLFLGPFGIDPDSILVKFSKQDSILSQRFIERACKNFRKVIAECHFSHEVQTMTDADIFEALRLQIIRISTIGLSNADFVVDQSAMPSLKGSYESFIDMLKIFVDRLPTTKINLQNEFARISESGKKQIREAADFNSLNHMEFLTSCLIPMAAALSDVQQSLQIPVSTKFMAVNTKSSNIYDVNAFNVDFFAPGNEAYLTKAKAELGKFLFFDPILSDNNQRACASCHKPELAFTDGNVRSMNFERGDLPRNAPTVINSGFQKAQFWDLRSNSLEDQLDSVINSADELHSSFENVIERINSSEEYKKMFHAAFPETKKTGIQRKHVKIAIASYERVLTGLNSRFDQYVRGDDSKMNQSEINGFNIYMGKAKCGSCHYAPLFNGALPPYFEFTDHRSIGVPLKDSMVVYEVDKDTGASRPFNNPFFHFSFKVPTVRNVELTAPYMHNGVFKTLEQVVNFYNDAGGEKFIKDMRPGLKGLPFFMILPEPLRLTEPEKKDLIAFMKTLTDTTAAKNVPSRLPDMKGKYASLNKRKIGGEY